MGPRWNIVLACADTRTLEETVNNGYKGSFRHGGSAREKLSEGAGRQRRGSGHVAIWGPLEGENYGLLEYVEFGSLAKAPWSRASMEEEAAYADPASSPLEMQ